MSCVISKLRLTVSCPRQPITTSPSAPIALARLLLHTDLTPPDCLIHNHHMTNATDIHPLVATLAAQLGETKPQPLAQLGRVVEVLGADTAQQIVRDTLAIEAEGGRLTANGKRRRTSGGVFFQLVRERTPRELLQQIFPKQKKQGPRRTRKVHPRLPIESLDTLLSELTDYGTATTVKITVIGRPGQTMQRGEVVIVGMTSDRAPTLPAGLPVPPQQTKYVVLIARKQWGRVSEALEDGEDRLIVEGYPAYAASHAGITVYATSVTTGKLQAAKRQTQASRSSGAEG